MFFPEFRPVGIGRQIYPAARRLHITDFWILYYGSIKRLTTPEVIPPGEGKTSDEVAAYVDPDGRCLPSLDRTVLAVP